MNNSFNGRIYVLAPSIEKKIDEVLTTLSDPLYSTICSIYKQLRTNSFKGFYAGSKVELVYFMYYTLEHIRRIREITVIHPTHISYLAQKLNCYIEDINKIAKGTLTPSTYEIYNYRILYFTLLILSKTGDTVLENFANNAIPILQGMYNGVSKTPNSYIKKEIFEECLSDHVKECIKLYTLTNSFFIFDFSNQQKTKCRHIERDMSQIIHEHIFHIMVEQTNEMSKYQSHPHVLWEDIVEEIEATDDIGELRIFLDKIIKNMPDIVARDTASSMLSKKIEKIREEQGGVKKTVNTTNNFNAPISNFAHEQHIDNLTTK